MLDVERFVDTIDDGHVGVLQVVPSYLEAVLTYWTPPTSPSTTYGVCRPPAKR